MKQVDKIMTLHPEGKRGVNIDLAKYNTLKNYILNALRENKTTAFKVLFENSIRDLQPNFDGKVGWYCVTVKLDLEARNIIERIPKTSPHQLRLVK